jgi:malate/lactate dehydrogenase
MDLMTAQGYAGRPPVRAGKCRDLVRATSDFLARTLYRVGLAGYESIEREGETDWSIALPIAHRIGTIQEDKTSSSAISVRLHGEQKINQLFLSNHVRVGIDNADESIPLSTPKI